MNSCFTKQYGNSLSQKTENIAQLPDGNKVKLISIGGSGIDVGSTGEKIPSWSFGIFLPSSGGSDACLLCANSTQITLAYKSSLASIRISRSCQASPPLIRFVFKHNKSSPGELPVCVGVLVFQC